MEDKSKDTLTPREEGLVRTRLDNAWSMFGGKKEEEALVTMDEVAKLLEAEMVAG